jgi:hypothetical protein
MGAHIHVILGANVVCNQLFDFGDMPQQGTLRVLDGEMNPDRKASVNIE